ncbi:hypothetical protein L1049_023961 [Liquidambar formosana]|uniref:Uncharacterized protein n=1 Tax=Liquidambar formosana TaxID=63359 RepID=A0AAP0WY16_LIQFO
MAMNTLVRSTTFSLDRRFDAYEPLDQSGEMGAEENSGWRTFSKRNKESHKMITSFSYRRDRARKRQIFLRTYKLGSVNTSEQSTSGKLKKVFGKVKTVVVTVVAFARIGSLRSWNCRSAVCGSSPVPVRKSY